MIFGEEIKECRDSEEEVAGQDGVKRRNDGEQIKDRTNETAPKRHASGTGASVDEIPQDTKRY